MVQVGSTFLFRCTVRVLNDVRIIPYSLNNTKHFFLTPIKSIGLKCGHPQVILKDVYSTHKHIQMHEPILVLSKSVK